MDVSIVQAGREDAAEILALQMIAYRSEAKLNDDWSTPPLTQTLFEIQVELETKVFLKAVYKDSIVGSVRAFLDSGACPVGRLVVCPDYRRNGIGARLMKEIEINNRITDVTKNLAD